MGAAPEVPVRRRLSGLDGLRAVAALLVVAYHVGLARGYASGSALSPLVAELKAGVTIFFVISGCVLYLPYARALIGGGRWPDWREYARRRALRILPAYWLALAAVAIALPSAEVFGPAGWRYWALAQIYDPFTTPRGLGVAWSLDVELSFYVVLPLWAALMRRLVGGATRPDAIRRQLAAVAALAAGSLALRAGLAHSAIAAVPPPGWGTVTALPGLLDWFAAGMALAVVAGGLERGLPPPRPLAALTGRPALCLLGGAGLFAAAAVVQPQDLFLPRYGLAAHVLMGLAAGLLVAPLVLGEPSRITRALNGRRAVWLGTVSYGIYLWHTILLDGLLGSAGKLAPARAQGGGGTIALLAVISVGAIGCGALSWYAVERPLSRRLARAGAAVPAPARAV